MNLSFDINGFIENISKYPKNKIEYTRDCPLASLTTFKIGGACTVAVFPENAEQLVWCAECAIDSGAKVKVIGRGSNLLCSDDGFCGIVIVTDNATSSRVEGDIIECECGMSLTSLSNEACDNSLSGAEFMYGIPGSVGGGVFMNAGAYGGQMSDVVIRVECMNMNTKEKFVLMREELDYAYRHSVFMAHPEYLILTVMCRFRRGERDKIYADMKDYISRRRQKQPLEFPSAGSTFKRCEGYYTSQLIDEAGLKGLSVGGAQVSEKHAGFVINRGGATASDVLSLIDKVKEEIKKKYGVCIECEVEYFE